MARIIVPLNTLVGKKLINITQQIVNLSDDVTRLKSIVDAIGQANLESSTESLMPTGQGAGIYAGIGQIKTAIDTLATLVATIDQG